jgi:hypothetical protein
LSLLAAAQKSPLANEYINAPGPGVAKGRAVINQSNYCASTLNGVENIYSGNQWQPSAKSSI